MNSLLRIPYALAGTLVQGLSYITPEGDSKLRRGLTVRRGILSRYRQWAHTSRQRQLQLVWFHAPSVGEGLQALPVVRLLRARRPDVQIAYTHYSPSAEQFAKSTGADFIDYIPFDTYRSAAAAIAALQPSAIVFSKLDVWPALAETAGRGNVKLGVISATLPEYSGRRNLLARWALGDAYRALDRVGAVSEEDAERLREQGVAQERIAITGDTRYDQVWTRARGGGESALVESLRSTRPTLVAGSTWPTDEARLLAAWIDVRRRVSGARLIIAPHEISHARLGAVLDWARSHDISIARIGEGNAVSSEIVLVDRYGVLGDLYALAAVAYVGGGFHGAGLHSVLEPAAFGAAVVFGPRHEKSRDAFALIACAGGYVARDDDELGRRLIELLGSTQARDAAGFAARAMVQSGLGAAERSYQLVTALLGR